MGHPDTLDNWVLEGVMGRSKGVRGLADRMAAVMDSTRFSAWASLSLQCSPAVVEQISASLVFLLVNVCKFPNI